MDQIKNLCILRLSAIGDVCHMVAIAQLLQRELPHTQITWIIGKLEHSLVRDLPGIEFIVFDKAQGIKAYWQLFKTMRSRRFDVLLHMQVALRASLASLFIPAKLRIGFDKARARDCQWLFSNKKIKPEKKQHVLDGFLGFVRELGIINTKLSWRIPISTEDKQFARNIIKLTPTLIVVPVASHYFKTWKARHFAAVIQYAIEHYGMQVILCGGPSDIEKDYGETIEQAVAYEVVNMIGKTSLKQLLALIDQSSIVLAPDTGPLHMATLVNTPSIGLYANTNPTRTGPYLNQSTVINQYPQALKQAFNQTLDQAPWGKRIKEAKYMNLISVEEVCLMLDKVYSKLLSKLETQGESNS